MKVDCRMGIIRGDFLGEDIIAILNNLGCTNTDKIFAIIENLDNDVDAYIEFKVEDIITEFLKEYGDGASFDIMDGESDYCYLSIATNK